MDPSSHTSIEPSQMGHDGGLLASCPDHRYGALAILRVNGQPAPQRIFATPKFALSLRQRWAVSFPTDPTERFCPKVPS